MKDLDKILDRYFEGETTLDEEKTLREYFQQDNIPEEYAMYAPMFRFFVEERAVEIPKESKIPVKRRKLSAYIWGGVAAGILLAVGIKAVYSYQENYNTSKSMVYIDGKKISDKSILNKQALISIQNVSDIDAETLDSQIAVLDLFTE